MRKHPLKSWRDDKGLTLEGAAKTVGVTRECWRLWETGKHIPDSVNMRKLMQRCGVKPDQIYAAAS